MHITRKFNILFNNNKDKHNSCDTNNFEKRIQIKKHIENRKTQLGIKENDFLNSKQTVTQQQKMIMRLNSN